MDLTTREEIAAPRAAVWNKLTDFAAFENLARKRKIPVERLGTDARPEWQTRVAFRGVERDVTLHVADMRAPELLELSGRGGGMGAVITATLTALGPDRTALDLKVTVRGTNLAGRALVQGLRLGQGALQDRFGARVKKMVQDIGRASA
jgi:carbon monoxide dehydrogenase subunit G